MTNFLDPAEVEAWLAAPHMHPDHKFHECFVAQREALEQFVRALADRGYHQNGFRVCEELLGRGPCNCSLGVARLLVKAMGEK